MFQWFHVGCLSPVLNSGLWFGHVIWMQECWSQLWTPTPTRVPLLFCLFGFFDNFSFLVFRNNQHSHNSLSNRHTKHRTYINNNQRNIYWHTETNRDRNKQAKEKNVDFDQFQHFYFNFSLPAVCRFISAQLHNRQKTSCVDANHWMKT